MLVPFEHPVLVATVLGPVSHHLWFRHGEHDFCSRYYVVSFAIIETILYWALHEKGTASANHLQATITAAYLGGLFASIFVYRAYMHPLRHFPGPFSWKISKFAQVIANRDCHGWKHVHKLHENYGPFVRTGPNELSIIHPAAPQVVIGPGGKCKKAIWYDMGSPLVSMHQMRDKSTHDKRRRIWDHAFSTKSLRSYTSRVEKHADQLLSELKRFGGGSVNASKWFNFYSFDVMGDLAFGKSFDMLTSGKTHSAIKRLQDGMAPMSFAFAVPWLFWILLKIPFISDEYYKFITWSEQQALRRKELTIEEPDILHWILQAPPMSEDESVNRNWLAGDARLIIVAGSDTTAATLSFATAELLRNPECIGKLREEVDPLLREGLDQNTLQKAPYLNSIINETLRLHPPVPSVLLRVAPPEGIDIEGVRIPGNTIINLPLFTIQRYEEAYEHATSFVPERWTTRPGMIKDKRAYAPFSLGAFNCIGKNLALMELRTVLSRLFCEFDVSFAPGEDGTTLFEDTTEHFTLSLADLNVCLKSRKEEE